MNKYLSNVSLVVLGPFITAATGTVTYGLHKSFHRDYKGRLVIPASHIKGKLRMALEELAEHCEDILDIPFDQLLGRPSVENSYDPLSGNLKFTDFTCIAEHRPSRRTRIAINYTSQTASENMLWESEETFASSEKIYINGTVKFFSESDDKALEIVNALRLGFKWLTNLGAEKGVGFGRLLSARVTSPIQQSVQEMDLSILTDVDAIYLRVIPLEPIIIGGVKKPRSNYVQSERILPGGLIKGALATALNRVQGISPSYRELSPNNANSFPGFEALVSHFGQIRVTHGFPARAYQPRPVKLPVSTIKIGTRYADTALSPEEYPMVKTRAPAYFIDWKEPEDYWGQANPNEIYITRTEIDDHSRRSMERQLFTYSFLCPEDDENEPVEWVCNVDFSAIENKATRQLVKRQFAQAVYSHLDRLGKLEWSANISISDGYADPAIESVDLIHDNIILITLQTDAMMLNPESVHQLSLIDDLSGLYSDFWDEVSSSCLELVDFFAHQTFRGGYLYHRYLGAAERTRKPDNYKPYYLTCAGSVFKLRSIDDVKARQWLTRWLKLGLDLPSWAQSEYSQYGRALWQNCPFVPQNGYGEIAVNLTWHWEHKI
ncbi:MAG: hypothetical protein JXA78_00010 [Anaerolineales bacterium]|nr:hypothetical protein [Anaerolineales bacterium]